MEASLLKNYQQALMEKHDRLVMIAKPYATTSPIQAELDGIEALQGKIRDAKPEIMFYGIYNAGKSSVLNELLGSDQAKVDDIPTTDRIDTYEWNGYRIVDTPGVDAPIEHERVTEQHLAQADVVLFVISTDGAHDYLQNYLRLKSIADRKKKLIIVLNDKDSKLANPMKAFDQLTEEERRNAEELNAVKRQVAANCREAGLRDEDYVIVEVNAKRAQIGRLKGKTGLIAMSNMKALETCIFSELKRMPTFDILRRAISEIEQHLGRMIQTMEQGESDADAQTVNGFLERIHAERKAAREEIASYIDRRSSRLGKDLPGLIWAHRDEGQEAVNALVQKEEQAFAEDVQQKMKQIVGDMLEELHVALEDFAGALEKMQIHPASEISLKKPDVSAMGEPIALDEDGSGKKKLVAVLDVLEDVLKNIPLPGPLTAAGKSNLPGLASIVAAPLLPSLPPVVGPLVIIGLLKTFLGGSDDDDRRRRRAEQENAYERKKAEAELQARQNLQQQCKYIAERAGDDIRRKMEVFANQIMDDVQRPFKEQAASSKGEAEKRLKDVNDLRELYSEYEAVGYELSSMA